MNIKRTHVYLCAECCFRVVVTAEAKWQQRPYPSGLAYAGCVSIE